MKIRVRVQNRKSEMVGLMMTRCPLLTTMNHEEDICRYMLSTNAMREISESTFMKWQYENFGPMLVLKISTAIQGTQERPWPWMWASSIYSPGKSHAITTRFYCPKVLWLFCDPIFKSTSNWDTESETGERVVWINGSLQEGPSACFVE